MACTRWSSLVCFGGVGAGEVVTADGRKVVGLAQRRNRRGPGSTVPACSAGTRRPWSSCSPWTPPTGRAAVIGLGAAVAGAADLADELGVPAPDGRAQAFSLIASLPSRKRAAPRPGPDRPTSASLLSRSPLIPSVLPSVTPPDPHFAPPWSDPAPAGPAGQPVPS